MAQPMPITGACHCGAVRFVCDGVPEGEGATTCNCTVCRRYGALWVYAYEGDGIRVSGATTAYRRGESIGFHFCPVCGCVAYWRALDADTDGRRRIAVNVRLADDPAAVAALPLDPFDGLDTFADKPRDGRCVADVWA